MASLVFPVTKVQCKQCNDYITIVHLTLESPPYTSVIVHTAQCNLWLNIYNPISKTTLLHSFPCVQNISIMLSHSIKGSPC